MRRSNRQDQGVPYRRHCRRARQGAHVPRGLPLRRRGGLQGRRFRVSARCRLPEGVDVYFDNTAGPISDSVMRRLNVGARVVICGTASIASWDPLPQGPRVERHLLVKRARMQGFLIFDYAQRHPEALRELESWVRDGQIRYREDILDGIEQAPGSIAGLYRGENLGKRLIRIAPNVPCLEPSAAQTQPGHSAIRP